MDRILAAAPDVYTVWLDRRHHAETQSFPWTSGRLQNFSNSSLRIVLTNMNTKELSNIVSKESPGGFSPPAPEPLVEKAVEFLSSEHARQSLDSDPYWPKWCSPWWHILLLYELGLASRIPESILEKMVDRLDNHFLKFFPFRLEDVPEGKDPYRHVMCHCALGTIHQALSAAGIDVDALLPWIRPWYLRYQIADGGLNCDEAAYNKCPPRSSVVSTLPPMEAMLNCTGREFTQNEISFLDKGADYLLERKLVRSRSKGSLIDKSWLKLCFPRFYHYDQLRGLSFVLKWALRFNRKLHLQSIAECLTKIDSTFPDGRLYVQRNDDLQGITWWLDSAGWAKAPAKTFPLLEELSKVGSESAVLTKIWSDTRANLRLLMEENLLQI